MKTNKGITLISSLMMIVLATLAVLGVTVFLGQRQVQNVVKVDEIEAIYLAQAGIHDAVYQYREYGTITPGQKTVATGQTFTIDVVIVAGDKLEATDYSIAGKNFTLDVKKIGADPVTLERITVTWVPDNNEKVREIWIEGTRVFNGSKGSGDEIDISDYTFNDNNLKTLTFNFNKDISSKNSYTFNLQLGDESVHTIIVTPSNPAPIEQSSSSGATVKSTGETNGVWRTIEAELDFSDPGAAQITSWKEIDEKITP